MLLARVLLAGGWNAMNIGSLWWQPCGAMWHPELWVPLFQTWFWSTIAYAVTHPHFGSGPVQLNRSLPVFPPFYVRERSLNRLPLTLSFELEGMGMSSPACGARRIRQTTEGPFFSVEDPVSNFNCFLLDFAWFCEHGFHFSMNHFQKVTRTLRHDSTNVLEHVSTGFPSGWHRGRFDTWWHCWPR